MYASILIVWLQRYVMLCQPDSVPTKKVTGSCRLVQAPSNDAQQVLSESVSGMSDSGLGRRGRGQLLPRDRHLLGNKPVNKQSCASHARRQDECCKNFDTVMVLWSCIYCIQMQCQLPVSAAGLASPSPLPAVSVMLTGPPGVLAYVMLLCLCLYNKTEKNAHTCRNHRTGSERGRTGG